MDAWEWLNDAIGGSHAAGGSHAVSGSNAVGAGIRTRAQSMGAQLRAARERMHLSQAEVARAAGVSRGFLSRLENNRANPTWAILQQVAGVLGCEPVVYLVANASSVSRTAADIAGLSPTERLVSQPIDVYAALDLFAQAGRAGLEYAVTGDVAGLLQGLPTPLRKMQVLVRDDDATLLVHEDLLLSLGLLFEEVGPDRLRGWPERTWAIGGTDVTVRLVGELPLTTTVALDRFEVRVVAAGELLGDPSLPDLSCG